MHFKRNNLGYMTYIGDSHSYHDDLYSGYQRFFVVRGWRKTAPEKPNLLLWENDMTNYSSQQERKREFNNFKITLLYRRLKFQKHVSRSVWLENSVRWLKDSWENSTNSILSIILLMKSSSCIKTPAENLVENLRNFLFGSLQILPVN